MKSEHKYSIGDPKVISFGLKFGLIEKDEIVSLADSEILREDNPDYFWIEVSMMSEKPLDALISLLAEKTRAPLNRDDMLSIFRLVYVKLLAGSISTEVAMRAIVFEFRTSDLVTSYEFGEMNGLDYSYCDGIDQGWSSLDDVKRDLLGFLKRYNED